MSLSFVRSSIASLHGYVPGEQPQGGRVIKLNTNENPYPPSERVLAAIRAETGECLRLYPDPMANRLRDAAATLYGLQRDNVLVGNGSDELLGMILRTCIDPGDRVVFPTPTYSLYDTLVAIQGGEIVRLPYGSDFVLPAGIVEAGGKVTFLCHPNAPSGTPLPREAMEDVARRSSGLVVFDEAYADFADWSALPLVGRYENVVVLRSFSKSFSLAGLRIGLAFGSPAVLMEMAKVKDSYNLDRLAIVAAAAALEDHDGMRANVARIRATRARLTGELRSRGWQVLESQTNFVLARRAGERQEPNYLRLREGGILVRWFDTPELHDALRITIGTDEEIDALLSVL